MKSSFLSQLRTVACAAFIITGFSLLAADDPLYQNDFQSHEANAELPDDFLVLGGDFSFGKEGDNTFLTLPGTPLDSFGLMFGPSKKDDIDIRVRIHGINRKRRYPAFAVGLGGVGGYRLQVTPAKRKIEMIKGDDILTSIDHKWQPDTWTWLRLRVHHTSPETWTVQGKVWNESDPEPEDWMLTFKTDKKPYGGRSSVWGQPYAGTPIHFDDIHITGL